MLKKKKEWMEIWRAKYNYSQKKRCIKCKVLLHF